MKAVTKVPQLTLSTTKPFDSSLSHCVTVQSRLALIEGYVGKFRLVGGMQEHTRVASQARISANHCWPSPLQASPNIFPA
jgi:hypothetical protein